MRRVLVALVLAALGPWSAAPASACDFKLGFAEMHGLMPEKVGACRDDERYDPTTGDALQDTTGGLLVWRRADNIVAFTDGATTWLIGRFGLVDRPNDQRFAWEAPPPPPPPLPVAPMDVGGVVLSDFRTGRTSDPRYGEAVPFLSFTVRNTWNLRMPVTDPRMLYSARFVDGARDAEYGASLATPDPLPPEGLAAGAKTTVVLYALVPTQPGLAAPPPPTSVELYQGLGTDGQARLLATFALGG